MWYAKLRDQVKEQHLSPLHADTQKEEEYDIQVPKWHNIKWGIKIMDIWCACKTRH